MALYYTAHLEWFQNISAAAAPPWSTEQFLRNAVFDAATGSGFSIERSLPWLADSSFALRDGHAAANSGWLEAGAVFIR